MKNLVLFSIIVLCLSFVGCNDEPEEIMTESEIIMLDEKPFYNLKIKTNSSNIPLIIESYEKVVDMTYSNYFIETYDSDFELVWSLKWRDLQNGEVPEDSMRKVYKDKLVVKIGNVISIHDLMTGSFLWELETLKEDTSFYVSNDMIYALYSEEDFITAVDIETGKKVLHIPFIEKYSDMIGIEADDTFITAYGLRDDLSYDKQNSLKYNLNGEFKGFGYKNNNEVKPEIVKWDSLEVSSSEIENSEMNLLDMSNQTVWSEGVKGYGEKEWIEITRNLPTIINKLAIYNGDQSSQKTFDEHSKIKKATINIGYGKSFDYIFTNSIYGEYTVLEFLKPITSDYILITIVEADPGIMYKNTSVTDIFTQ